MMNQASSRAGSWARQRAARAEAYGPRIDTEAVNAALRDLNLRVSGVSDGTLFLDFIDPAAVTEQELNEIGEHVIRALTTVRNALTGIHSVSVG